MYPDESNLTTLASLKQQLDPAPAGGITEIDVTVGGSGYTSAPTVSVVDPKGSGAVAVATVANGVVTGVQVTTPGSGYTTPSVTFTGGGGTGASATAKIGMDDFLTLLINEASSTLVEILSIDPLFDSGSDMTEKRNGNGQDFIQTFVRPIISVTSLTVSPQFGYGLSQPTTIPVSDGTSAGYIVDSDAGVIYLVGGYTFYRGRQNVTLKYRGGIALGHRWQRALERACLVTCALWWKQRPHLDQSSQAMAQGMGTINFKPKDIPDLATQILDQIRRVAPVPR